MTRSYIDDDTAFYNSYMYAQNHSKRANRTPELIASVHWNNMRSRVKKGIYLEKGIKVLWTKEEFVAWFTSEKQQNRCKAISDTKQLPSIDRINSNGHYEESNCRIIPWPLNRRLGEINGLITQMAKLQKYVKDNEFWLHSYE